jgi:hypothetical protein
MALFILSCLFILTLAARNTHASCHQHRGDFVCDNFQSWPDLDYLIFNKTILVKHPFINIHPTTPIMFSSELDISGLFASFGLKKPDESNKKQLSLNLIGISGIDLVPWPTSGNNSQHHIAFENSQIDFFMNGEAASEKKCSKNLITTNSTFFTTFSQIRFIKENKYPKSPICPFIFANAHLEKIFIYNQVKAVLINNLWRFQTLDESANESIFSNIKQLTVSGFGYDFNTSLVHPLVFEKIQQLTIYRSIGSIQLDLLKRFQQLDTVKIQMDNLRNFFHKIGLAWTQSLLLENSPWIVFSTEDEKRGNWIDGSAYSYPDSDLCLFAQYSKQSKITYIINASNLTTCTSTIRFLISNYFTQNMSDVFDSYPNTKSIYLMCSKIIVNETLDTECGDGIKGSYYHAEFYQIQFITEFVHDLLIFVFIPCACVLGFLLNFQIIWKIRKHSTLKDDFYKFMSLNAVFNCLYCSIFLFYPINSCIEALSDYFCSSIYTSYAAQYYKIIFEGYAGESIKMCANISYILITVNRCMLIGQDHGRFLKKIAQLEFARIVKLAIGFSFLFNIGHIFQNFFNNGRVYDWDTPDYMELYQTFPQINENSNSVFYYLLVYFILNYLLFFVVNTLIEIVLLRKLHRELVVKSRRLTDMEMATRALNARTTFRRRRKQDIEKKAEQRAIAMVVINALLNFFLRLPELFFLFSISKKIFNVNFLEEYFLAFPSLKFLWSDLTYLFYILTFTTNFFIYYLFNQKFKRTFSKRIQARDDKKRYHGAHVSYQEDTTANTSL